METFKRNQVEEAIARLFGETSGPPSSALSNRMKRLLDEDRKRGRKSRANDPELANYAFYSSESPGKGIEVDFSEYDAFALFTSLRLLHHGWPQGFAVSMLRRLRPELERQHGKILRLDPEVIFNKEAIRQKANEGDLVVNTTDPVFLLIASHEGNSEGPTGSIHRGVSDVFEVIREKGATSWTFHELVVQIHKLREALAKVPPRKRGRVA